LIADRVKCGLANARAKGKLIGRRKLRDSDLIRKLIKSGLSYRQISVIAKCSHGSVSAERAAMKRDELELTKKLEGQAAAEKELRELGTIFPEIPKAEPKK
jgi:DNA invertase Pin-like site-specific DNA recombinase